MYNVGMIRVYRLKCYSLEMFSVCINVMVYLECTFISAYVLPLIIHYYPDPLG